MYFWVEYSCHPMTHMLTIVSPVVVAKMIAGTRYLSTQSGQETQAVHTGHGVGSGGIARLSHVHDVTYSIVGGGQGDNWAGELLESHGGHIGHAVGNGGMSGQEVGAGGMTGHGEQGVHTSEELSVS